MVENSLTHDKMEKTMRDYFDACNKGDIKEIKSYFIDDAMHYFPPGMYGGPFVGGETIGERWANAVDEIGSIWTVDRILTDPDNAQAVMEWTHFKTYEGAVLRGDEWYEFDPDTGLIKEIRAYYAAPQSPEIDRHELGGFNYEERGYPVEPPFNRE